MSRCPLTCVFLSLLFIPACVAQTDPKYQNSDPPNCGSFHMRTLQGTVTDGTGAILKDVEVQVFDDVSRKPLWKTVTDGAGRFSTSRRFRGQLRIVFFSSGFLTEDWAVTLVHWPDGGFFRAKTLLVGLRLHPSDNAEVCDPLYSR